MKICRNLTFLSRLRQISRLKVVVILLFFLRLRQNSRFSPKKSLGKCDDLTEKSLGKCDKYT